MKQECPRNPISGKHVPVGGTVVSGPTQVGMNLKICAMCGKALPRKYGVDPLLWQGDNA